MTTTNNTQGTLGLELNSHEAKLEYARGLVKEIYGRDNPGLEQEFLRGIYPEFLDDFELKLVDFSTEQEIRDYIDQLNNRGELYYKGNIYELIGGENDSNEEVLVNVVIWENKPVICSGKFSSLVSDILDYRDCANSGCTYQEDKTSKHFSTKLGSSGRKNYGKLLNIELAEQNKLTFLELLNILVKKELSEDSELSDFGNLYLYGIVQSALIYFLVEISDHVGVNDEPTAEDLGWLHTCLDSFIYICLEELKRISLESENFSEFKERIELLKDTFIANDVFTAFWKGKKISEKNPERDKRLAKILMEAPSGYRG